MVLQSKKILCSAVVASDLAEKYSLYSAVEPLSSRCLRHDIPGITRVDTRAITTLLRDQGTTSGRLAVNQDASTLKQAESEYWDPTTETLVDQVSTKIPCVLNPTGGVEIAVLDFEVKANILRSLIRRYAAITVLPWTFDFNTVRDEFEGLFLTNGPGDPTNCMEAALHLRQTLKE